ncbi:hypothetical protein E3N88_39262 [Mikania micrantha]|uniref:Uncharacterized protein n=1 Tax=Mikania micrantha TaxID=192012 RepID=A0A5N6LX40_9ASTR|nr:hypothetical protein E3N88_39262 [Mikania micrantha]
MTDLLVTLTNNLIARVASGKAYGFQHTVHRIAKATTRFSVGNYFPSFTWMDRLSGLLREADEIFKESDDLFEGVIEERVNKKDFGIKGHDLVDILLEIQKDKSTGFELERYMIKAIILLCADVSNSNLFAAMADRGEQYQLAPHDMRDGTPSSSSAPDSDSSEASTAASRAPSVVPQAQPALPHSPLEPRPVTPPPPALPIIPSPPHLPPVDPVADRMQSISPPRVPVWDGLRRMRGQVRKTTGLPPRKQLAPRDEFHARHEMGESSHQVELRAQLQQVTQNLQGTQQSLQQCQATVEDTRRTILDILTSHLTLMDQVKALDTDTRAWRTAMDDRLRMTWGQIMLAAFWRQVAWMTEGWSWVRERVTEFLAWFGVASTETRMMILAVVMAIVAMILSFLSYFMR